MWTVCNDWFERREGGRRGYAMIPDFRALFAGRVELAPASRPQSHTWPAPLCAAIALCAACSDALVRGRPLSALRLLSVRHAQTLSFVAGPSSHCDCSPCSMLRCSCSWPAPLCAAIALCAACSDALVRGRPLSVLRLLSVRRAQILSFCTACTWQGGVRTTGPCLMTCDIQRGQSCVYHLCEPYFSDSERLRSFKFHCGWETKPL